MKTKFSTLTKVIIALGLGLWLAVMGSTGWAWLQGMSRLDEISRARAEAARIAQGGTPPPMSPQKLAAVYGEGQTAYQHQQYPAAIQSFQIILHEQPDYQEAAVLLLLSYKTLAENQAARPESLNDAPQTFDKALETAQGYAVPLQREFGQDPARLPEGSGTLENLINRLSQQRGWAEHYAAGNRVRPDGPGWWDKAIPEWEAVYQANPAYLKDSPRLALSTRLMDTYYSQAVYLCRSSRNYTGSLAALSRATEIGRLSGVGATKLKSLDNFTNFVLQSQCQVS